MDAKSQLDPQSSKRYAPGNLPDTEEAFGLGTPASSRVPLLVPLDATATVRRYVALPVAAGTITLLRAAVEHLGLGRTVARQIGI